jgi:hypothetical protein
VSSAPALGFLAPVPIRPAYRLPEYAEANLIGTWESAERKWTLHSLSNRRAIVQVGGPKEGQVVQVRFGAYTFERMGWMLTLEDIQGQNRKTYGVSLHQPDTIELVDSSGDVISLKRKGP